MKSKRRSIIPFLILSLLIHLGLLYAMFQVELQKPVAEQDKNVEFQVVKSDVPPPAPPVQSQPSPPLPQKKKLKKNLTSEPEWDREGPDTIPGSSQKSKSAAKPDFTPEKPKSPQTAALSPKLEVPQVKVPDDKGSSSLKELEKIPPTEQRPQSLMPSYAELTRYIERYEDENPDQEKSADIDMTFGGDGGLQFVSYLMRIKRKIEANFHYPALARETRLTGIANIFFIIEKDGTLSHTALIDSSRYRILDDSAIKALKLAAPFEPIPAEFEKNKFKINGYFIFN